MNTIETALHACRHLLNKQHPEKTKLIACVTAALEELRTPAKMFGVMPLPPEVVQPPTLATEFEGVEFAVGPIGGTAPFKYQWYVGAKKITDNATAQTETLSLRPPYTVGVYTCHISNEAGTITSKTFRLSLTSSATAADQQITINKP